MIVECTELYEEGMELLYSGALSTAPHNCVDADATNCAPLEGWENRMRFWLGFSALKACSFWPAHATPNVRSSGHRSLTLTAAPHWRGRTPALKPAGVGIPSLRGCRSTLSRWNPKQASLSRVVIQIRTIKLKEENARGLH
jgi:hypothetical protein